MKARTSTAVFFLSTVVMTAPAYSTVFDYTGTGDITWTVPTTGVYDITVRLDGLAQGPVSSDNFGNALVLAIQHAGFKFVSKKGPLTVVVVEHIDPPTPN